MKEEGLCTCLHNFSDDLATNFNLVIVVILLPLISFVGLLFNTFSIIVFAEQKGTAAKYLAALSCSDVGVCMAGILVIASDSLRAHSFFIDQIFVHLLPSTIPLCLFFQMLSVYITVLAAFDCYAAVRGGEAITPRRGIWAPRVLAGVVVLVALYNIIQFADLKAVECVHPEQRNLTMYELCPTELRLSDSYVVIYKGYMYALSMAILPFILLTVLTVGILMEMKRQEENEEAKSDNSVKVLLLVIFLFLFCNVTSLTVNIFEMFKVSFGEAIEAILVDIGNFMVVINATANFFIYWFTSPEYRESVKRLFCRSFCRPTDVLDTKVDFV